MGKIYISLFLLLLFLLKFQSGYCKYSEISFERLSVENGLSHSSVFSITQDSKGFIWVGCVYGLNRYDGLSFKQYTTSSQHFPYSVSKNNIQSLLSDNNDRLWIGTGADLHLLDQRRGVFRSFDYNSNNPVDVESNVVKTLYQDSKQYGWMGTSNGVVRIIEKNNELKFEHFHTVVNNQREIIGYVNSIIEDEKGDIWAATRDGLFFLESIEKQSFCKIKGQQQKSSFNPGANISKLFVDNRGYVWSVGNDFLRIEKESIPEDFQVKTIKELTNNKYNFLGVFVSDILQTDDGYFWLATNHGLYILGLPEYTGNNQVELYNHKHIDNDPSSLSNNMLTDLFIDESGVVWIGSISGLNKYDYSKHIFRTETFKEVSGSVSPDIRSVCRDKYGNYWFGTFKNGIIYKNNKTGEVKKIHKQQLIDRVFAICEDDDGVFWLGVNQINWGSLIRMKLPVDYSDFNVDEIEFEQINVKDKNINSSFKRISDIKRDDEGHIWVSEGATTVCMEFNDNRRTGTPYFHEIRYENDQIPSKTVDFDENGNVWLATYPGNIVYYNKKTNEVHHLPDSLSDYPGMIRANSTILSDNEQNIWIGTIGEGVSILDLKNRSVKRLSTREGLPSNIIMALAEHDNDMWATTINGISKIDKESLSVTNYYRRDGLEGVDFNNNSILNVENKKLLFGGVTGLSVYDFSLTDYSLPSPPKVEIIGLSIKNKEVNYYDKDNKYLDKPIQFVDTICLSYNDYPFTIKMSALSYASPGKIKYRYKLEGYDKSWVETSQTFPYASYGQLTGGVYELNIVAAGFDGKWSKKTRKLFIVVEPPFWYKLWFYIVLMVLLTALMVMLVHLRTRAIRSKNIHLETIVQKRTKELENKNSLLHYQTDEMKRVNLLLENRQQELEEQANEIEAQRDSLAKSNAAKDKLFSIVSHDLRSPFNSIIGFAEILHTQIDMLSDEKISEISGALYNNSLAYYDFLDKLLHWAKTQTGSVNFRPAYFNVYQIVSRIFKIFDQETKLKNIKLTNNIPVDLEIYADSNMIDAVFRNLIGNAVKFTENGTVSVDFIDRNEFYEFSVHDSGIGIQKENIRKLFDLSENYTTKGTNSEKGSGLGLLLCKEFVSYHQGSIWVDSNTNNSSPERGTAFYFTCSKKLTFNEESF